MEGAGAPPCAWEGAGAVWGAECAGRAGTRVGSGWPSRKGCAPGKAGKGEHTLGLGN